MAIYNVYLDLDSNYICLIKDIYKILVILIVFQVLVHYSNCSKNIINTALTGGLLNDEFMGLLLFVIIGFAAYHLVFERVLSIE